MDIDRGDCQYCGRKYKLTRGGLVHHERACLGRQVEEFELGETMAQIKLEHKAYLLRLARERDGEGVAGPIPFAPVGHQFMGQGVAFDTPQGPSHRAFEPLTHHPNARVISPGNPSLSTNQPSVAPSSSPVASIVPPSHAQPITQLQTVDTLRSVPETIGPTCSIAIKGKSVLRSQPANVVQQSVNNHGRTSPVVNQEQRISEEHSDNEDEAPPPKFRRVNGGVVIPRAGTRGRGPRRHGTNSR